MPSHFVVSCKPSWSHLRSLCVLSAKIICARPSVVTFLVADVDTLAAKVAAELARCLFDEGPTKGNVRVVAVGLDSSTSSFESIWKALINGAAVECACSGIVHPPEARPSLVILDAGTLTPGVGFQLSWLTAMRSTVSPPPILQWMMGFTGGFVRITGPASMGGRGDNLRSPPDCAGGGNEPIEGAVIEVPGMPPMYDWEFFPQAGIKSDRIRAAEVIMSKFVETADGLMTCGAVDYDGETCLDSIEAWIHKLNDRPTYHLGPMLPFKPGTVDYSPASKAAELATAPAGMGAKILDFLDRAHSQFGPNCLVYISFGTEHWPSSQSHLSALLLALERKGFPVNKILAHAYRTTQIPNTLRAWFDGSDKVLFTPWAPQQTILAHQACGWFVTHGGANGTMEAISQGVPMIGWPFSVDQPMNIAHLVYGLDVAFELLEVRTGELGLKTMFATGKTPEGTVEAFERELEEVLEGMKGEVGERKRQNARRIRQGLEGVWGDGSKTRGVFERFLERYCGP
ncbi:hypothetical protein BDD12DRAFT_876041 [Trichophaea hybrida]|nr:hypothetical protein BDD12DRAFT_876041 [Trichophaea hybrida]